MRRVITFLSLPFDFRTPRRKRNSDGGAMLSICSVLLNEGYVEILKMVVRISSRMKSAAISIQRSFRLSSGFFKNGGWNII